MKNFGINFIFLSLVFACFAQGAFAQKLIDEDYATKTIYEKEAVVYRPSSDSWVVGTEDADAITLTKNLTSGSGDYSEFRYEDNEVAFSFGTSFEFLYGERLVAYDKYSLKFFSVKYDPEKKVFEKKKLGDAHLDELFKDVKVIYVSEFKKDKYHLKKAPFKSQKILLVNDTPEYFYRYSFSGKNFEGYNLLGLLEVNKMGKITFSHPAPEFRNLYINVKPF